MSLRWGLSRLSSEPSVITRVLQKEGRGGRRSEVEGSGITEERLSVRTQPHRAGFADVEAGAMSQGAWAPLETRKGQETDSPQELPEGTHP